MVTLAFMLAYRLRILVPLPEPLASEIPFIRYLGLMVVQVSAVVITLFFYRQYYLPRAVSRVDQLYAVFAGVSIGTVVAVAVSAFTLKNSIFEVDYPEP